MQLLDTLVKYIFIFFLLTLNTRGFIEYLQCVRQKIAHKKFENKS